MREFNEVVGEAPPLPETQEDPAWTMSLEAIRARNDEMLRQQRSFLRSVFADEDSVTEVKEE